MWFSKLTRQQKIRRLALALWMPPLILLFPTWLAALLDPGLILEYPDYFLLFFGAPFAVAAALYVYAAKVGRTNDKGSNPG